MGHQQKHEYFSNKKKFQIIKINRLIFKLKFINECEIFYF